MTKQKINGLEGQMTPCHTGSPVERRRIDLADLRECERGAALSEHDQQESIFLMNQPKPVFRLKTCVRALDTFMSENPAISISCREMIS